MNPDTWSADGVVRVCFLCRNTAEEPGNARQATQEPGVSCVCYEETWSTWRAIFWIFSQTRSRPGPSEVQNWRSKLGSLART
jgi:hypothetical protein